MPAIWAAVIGGTAMLGSAYMTTQAAGKQSGGQGTGIQKIVTSTEPMPRPAEYGMIMKEFMDQYFGEANRERLNKFKDLRSAKQELADLNNTPPRSTKENRHQIARRSGLEGKIASIQSWLDSHPSETASYQEALYTAAKEKDIAQKKYLEQLTGLKEPLLSTVEAAMAKHGGLLDEIINKRMAGEAIGPYGADIDKLLAERTGISFGGAEPMQFITGSQQRLLSDLMGAQETGLNNIAITSLGRAKAEKEPAGLRYLLGKGLAEQERSFFAPSNIDRLAYLQDLRSLWEPMEYTRYNAPGNVSTTMSGLPTQQQPSYLDQLQQIMNMGQGAANWASLLKSFTPSPQINTAGAAPAPAVSYI